MCITVTGLLIVDPITNTVVYRRKYNKRIGSLEDYRKRIKEIAKRRYKREDLTVYFRYNKVKC